MKKFMKLLLPVALMLGLVAAITPAASAAPAVAKVGPINAQLFVSPHPDDEFQSWSLIEGASSNYEVFVYVTRGSHSGYCDNTTAANAAASKNGAAILPATWPPGGVDSASCKIPRMESTIGFLNSMAAADSTLPTMSTYVNQTVSGLSVRNYNGGINGRVLFFDQPDGASTEAQVTAVVTAVVANASTLGISLPIKNITGGYRNGTLSGTTHTPAYPSCYAYGNPDHVAVHKALWNHDFGTAGFQYGATCAADPDVARTNYISSAVYWDMYAYSPNPQVPGTPATYTGKHHKYYAWLSANYGSFPSDSSGSTQNGILNAKQSFWARY